MDMTASAAAHAVAEVFMLEVLVCCQKGERVEVISVRCQ